jgi:hypothetical protein
MTQDKDYDYCPWGFDIRSGKLKNMLYGVRGKPRKAVQIAVARAVTLVNDRHKELKKEKRVAQANKLNDAYRAAEKKARLKLEAGLIKLYPENATYIPQHSPEWNNGIRMVDLCMRDYTNKLRGNVEKIATDIGTKYREQQRAREAKNPCGLSIPTAKDLKSVTQDPTLKAALDTFTKGLATQIEKEESK